MELHIIYTSSEMLLSKKIYNSWREIQEEYSDYKTSLGPWPIPEILDYLESEYSGLDPSPSTQINQFISSAASSVVLAFRPPQ